jgi:hypothetical protein
VGAAPKDPPLQQLEMPVTVPRLSAAITASSTVLGWPAPSCAGHRWPARSATTNRSSERDPIPGCELWAGRDRP